MKVFVVYADELPARGQIASASDRNILHVVDSAEKARELVVQLGRYRSYDYVDFDAFELE